MIPTKPARIEDRALLDSFHMKPCCVCGWRGCDPAHIQSVGSGGDDVRDNLMALCRFHHTEQHKIGWASFAIRYRGVAHILRIKGWEISAGKVRRQNQM